MLVDITERKRSEQALRQRERELHEAQRIARMGHWRLDIATGKLEWSDGTHLLMGTSPDDHSPSLKDMISRIHPDDRARVEATVHAAIASGAAYDDEFRILTDMARQKIACGEAEAARDCALAAREIAASLKNRQGVREAEIELARCDDMRLFAAITKASPDPQELSARAL